MIRHTRRAIWMGAMALAATPLLARAASARRIEMHVMKDPNCGCCADWVSLAEQDGFAVTVELRPNQALMQYKRESGIAPELASCHTARVDGYMIEGHVPLADVRRLLAERPDAIGLTVPGMPIGSPGMGDETAREAYDVLLRHGSLCPLRRRLSRTSCLLGRR